MKVKVSKYTLEFASNNVYFIYNSQTNILIRVNEEIHNIIHDSKKLNDGNLLFQFDEALLNKFKELKIIVEYEEEEKYLLDLEMNYAIKTFSTDRIILVIAPTTMCNFDCTYCFEKNKKNIKMSDDTIDSLINFLKEFKFSNKLHLTWYGGEPLLVTSIIEKILNRIKNELPNLKIKYHLLITNGYYLYGKHIRVFNEFPLDEVQVTLDGDKDRHDKIRNLKNKQVGTFDKIIANIDSFTKTYLDTKVTIRINLDKNNSKDFKLLRIKLNERWLGRNILIYPGILRIEDEKNKCMGCESLLHDDIRELFYEIGDDVHFYPSLKSKGCCATHVNSFVIGPEGEFYKCWNDVGSERKIIGYVNKKELTNKDLFNRYILSTNCFKNDECRECFFLPICVGGCAYYKLENLYEDGNYDLCSLYKKEGVLKKCLELHYNLKQKTNSNENKYISNNNIRTNKYSK